MEGFEASNNLIQIYDPSDLELKKATLEAEAKIEQNYRAGVVEDLLHTVKQVVNYRKEGIHAIPKNKRQSAIRIIGQLAEIFKEEQKLNIEANKNNLAIEELNKNIEEMKFNLAKNQQQLTKLEQIEESINLLKQDIRNKLEDLTAKTINSSTQQLPEQETHSQTKTRKDQEQTKLRTLIVLPKEGERIKEVKEKMTRLNCNLQLKNVKEKRDKIELVCKSEEDKELAEKILEEEDFKVVHKKPRKGKIMIFNLPTQMDTNTLTQALNDSLNIKDESFNIIWRPNKHKEQFRHAAVTSSKFLTSKLINQGKIIIGLNSYTIKRFVNITRCYRCQDYGHFARECRASKEYCGLCANSHPTEKCTSNRIRCINCKVQWDQGHDIDYNHTVTDSRCKIFREYLAGTYLTKY